MQQVNLHKQKLYAVIAAAIGFISVLLPWWKFSYGFGGFGGGYSINGLRDLGIITFLGFIGAGVVTFLMGDKTKPYEGQQKMIAAACFAGAALFALIQFIRQSHFTSIGLYLAILAGAAGAVIVYVLKPEQLEGTKPPAPPQS
jgi:peptidoglycan/LPS O-acetylase OafA/YrhL